MESRITIHGTMVCVFGFGVLIVGAPGVGKSRLAVELLNRGHQLVSDDATDLYLEGRHIIARCPPAIQNQLWLNPYGLIDAAHQWGPSAIKAGQRLDLIIHLSPGKPPKE